MVSSVLILLFIALANGKELCPNASSVAGIPCLPICNWTTLNRAAIPRVSFANGTIDDERNQLRPEDRFHVFEWDPCPEVTEFYPLDPVSDEDPHTYRLLRNGTLVLPYAAESEQFRNVGEYCLNFADNVVGYTPYLCLEEELTEDDEDERVKLICGLLSVPFLIATVWIYSVIPELKNTHGNTLRCYLCCLIVCLVTHVTRGMASLGKDEVLCLSVGYTAYFSFLASFLWLNVMCFNMWWMFGGFGALRNNAAQRSRKNFIYYSIYAWGVPALLTGICLCVELIPGFENSRYNPKFKSGSCWFSKSTPRASNLFSYGPVALTIIGNIFFFISTSIKISQHNCKGQQTKTANSSTNGKRQNHQNANFSLHLKLFVVMGILWVLEVMEWWITKPKLLWDCVEVINALQGVAIFVILVCKKNIWISLKGHYGKTLLQAGQYSKLFRCCVVNEEKSDSADSRESHKVVNKRDTVFTDDTSSSQLA